MILLDTSFMVRALQRGSPEDRSLRAWVRAGETLGMSTVAWGQFLCGPVSAAQIQIVAELIEEPIPFGLDESATAARFFNETGRRRGSFADCMIAATAFEAGAPIATTDVADFRRFERLGVRVLSLEK